MEIYRITTTYLPINVLYMLIVLSFVISPIIGPMNIVFLFVSSSAYVNKLFTVFLANILFMKKLFYLLFSFCHNGHSSVTRIDLSSLTCLTPP